MKTIPKNLQRQISNLICLVELFLPFIDEIEQTQNTLNFLPAELNKLKKEAHFLKFELPYKTDNSNIEIKIDEAEFYVDSLVDDLDKIFLHLTMMNYKLKNLLVIRERLEAIQEERIQGITPERIYKLLEKQQYLFQSSEDLCLLNTKNAKSLKYNYKQKNAKSSKDITNKKLAITVAIAISLYLGWLVGYSSTPKTKLNENQVVQETQKK